MTTENAHNVVCVDPSGRPHGNDAQKLIVSSPDANRLIAFYRRLGLSIQIQTDRNGRKAAIGRCPGFAAKFVAGQPASQEPSAPLGFLVDSISTLLPRLESVGGRIASPTQDQGDWIVAVVEDPDGRKIKLMQRVVLAAMEAEADVSIVNSPPDALETREAPSAASSGSQACASDSVEVFTIPAAIGATVRSFPWGMKVVLASFALTFTTASLVYFAVDRSVYFDENSGLRKVMAIVNLVSAVTLTAGMLQMLKLGSSRARALLIAAVAATIGGALVSAYANYNSFNQNRSLIHNAALIRLIGLMLTGGWYCMIPQSRVVNHVAAWVHFWFLALLVPIASAEYYLEVCWGNTDVAFFLLGVVGVCGFCVPPLVYYGWLALCIRLDDRLPEFLQPTCMSRGNKSAKALEPEQLRSLKVGTTMILAAIGAHVLLVGLSYFLTPHRGATRGVQPVAGPAIVITLFGSVAAVVQILGKLVLLRVGNAIERGSLLIAICIESFGLCLRIAAAMTLDSEPQTAAILLVCVFLCHGNELFLAYFFWSLAGRIGTTTSLNLARALFACTAAMVGAVLFAIIEPRSRDVMRFSTGTVVFCGILGFILLLALLNSLRLLATSQTAVDQR